jgi:MucR family transcriptional regulator, transcriptional regulator of exopolysaccharide biosynthesis
MCERQLDCQGILNMSTSSPIELAAEMVAAFVSNNPLPKGELAALIHAVHATVARLASEPESTPAQIEVKAPAVPIRKSITPDFLICLDDGKRFKSLRRHLAGLGQTPEQYREKWNLPFDYPMVAPNYAAQRSALAKQIGLGQIPRKAGVRKSGSRSKPVKT